MQRTCSKRRIWCCGGSSTSIEPDSNFFAWACQIIRYEVLKYREKRARAARLLDPDVFDRLAEVAIKQVEHLDEFHRRALVDCMDRLSAGDRDLMLSGIRKRWRSRRSPPP